MSVLDQLMAQLDGESELLIRATLDKFYEEEEEDEGEEEEDEGYDGYEASEGEG